MSDTRNHTTRDPHRGMAEHVLRHMGYIDAEIDRYTQPPDHELMGCEFDTNSLSWICEDEHGTSLHPDHDEAGQVVELLGVALESDAIAAVRAAAVAETTAAIEAAFDPGELDCLRVGMTCLDVYPADRWCRPCRIRAALSGGRTALDTTLADAWDEGRTQGRRDTREVPPHTHTGRDAIGQVCHTHSGVTHWHDQGGPAYTTKRLNPFRADTGADQ